MKFGGWFAFVLTAWCASGSVASAWGAGGHRIINADAVRVLPAGLPAFVSAPSAAAEIAALGPEADRLKGAGRSADADADPGHYLDLDDDGTVAGVVPLAQLPPTREAYDAAVRLGRTAGGVAPDQYRVGFLPYSIIDGWEVVVQDFAIWRVDAFGEAHAADVAARAAFGADRALRETLTLRDIGYWGHFVGDGSQPLHVSVHFNGWGTYPNPQHFTQAKTIHAAFETSFVDAHASTAAVLPRIAPYAPSPLPYPARVATYLQTTAANVPAVYRFAATGAFDAATPDAATPDAVGFMLDRLAAGAQMMRDGIVDAYASAADARVGYPGVRVRDVESGASSPPVPGRTV